MEIIFSFFLTFVLLAYMLLSTLTALRIHRACDDIGAIRSLLVAFTITPIAVVYKLGALGSVLGCMLWGVNYNELTEKLLKNRIGTRKDLG